MQASKIKPLNAKEFFKKHGFQESKELLKKSQDASFGGAPFFKNLQRLVASYGLVEACGGVDKVKEQLKVGNVFRFEEKPLMQQVIADVESCQ